MNIKFWSENLKGRDHLGDFGVHGVIIFKQGLKEQFVRTWIGLMWLRVGASGKLLWSQK